jgi:enoyl-CoA hydratase
MVYKNIEVVYDGPLAVIYVNRPKVHNALTVETMGELMGILKQLEREENVRTVVITGKGDKAFIAGGDIREFKDKNSVEALEFSRTLQKLCFTVETLHKPVIAAVNGYAFGAGCELMMACDIAYASAEAKIGLPEVGLGIIPGAGGTQRLSRLVGKARAKEIIFTAEPLSAQEAYQIRLVNRIFPPPELMEAVKTLCQKIASKGPIALRLCKETVEDGYEMDLYKANALEAHAFAVTFSTEDRKEGIDAFLEKRKPQFKGK